MCYFLHLMNFCLQQTSMINILANILMTLFLSETSPASIIISSQVVTSDNETSINSTVNSILLESPIELTFSINVSILNNIFVNVALVNG